MATVQLLQTPCVRPEEAVVMQERKCRCGAISMLGVYCVGCAPVGLRGPRPGDPGGPRGDDPERLRLEARVRDELDQIREAERRIEALVAEAERLWPDPERRWEVMGMGGGGHLYHAPIDQERPDE